MMGMFTRNIQQDCFLVKRSLTAIYLRALVPGGGGYSGFQVMGMIKGFFGFEIFDSGICLGRKIWQVFFWVA